MDDRIQRLERLWNASYDPDVGQALAAAIRSRGGDWIEARAAVSGGLRRLGPNEQGCVEYLHEPSGIVMVQVPEGSFVMGRPDERTSRPLRRVRFHRPFLISKYPVTQAQWKRVMETNPSYWQGLSDDERDDEGRLLDEYGDRWEDHPVESVTWSDIKAFLEKIGMRLPTEAMYEYCSRAGSETPYPCNTSVEELQEYAWVAAAADVHRAVGLKKPNSWGLHDMIGNVLSWTQDVYHRNYELAPTNGFVAWGDDSGYNHSLWVNGTMEDLFNNCVGLAEQDYGGPSDRLEDERDEPRRSVYGLNYKVAPRPDSAVSAGLSPDNPELFCEPDVDPNCLGPGRVEDVDSVEVNGSVIGPRSDPPRGAERSPSSATSQEQESLSVLSRSAGSNSETKRTVPEPEEWPRITDVFEEVPLLGNEREDTSKTRGGRSTRTSSLSECAGLEDPILDVPLSVPESVPEVEDVTEQFLSETCRKLRVLRAWGTAWHTGPVNTQARYRVSRWPSDAYRDWGKGFRVVWG